MAWIESHQELRRHPKTRRVMRTLGVPVAQAIGHLHCLWWWAMDYAQDGDLSRYVNGDIADAAEWTGDPEQFVMALVEAGFIDQSDDGMRLHDWDDYAGRLIDARIAGKLANEDRKQEAEQRILAAVERIQNRGERLSLNAIVKEAHCSKETAQRVVGPGTDPVHAQPGTVRTPVRYGPTVPNQTVPNQTREKDNAAAAADAAPRRPRAPRRLEFDPEDLEAAKLLAGLIRENNPTARAPNLDAWANDARLMRTQDKRTPEQIAAHIEWSQRDSFWRTNCLSMSSVRQHWDMHTGQMADPRRNGRAVDLQPVQARASPLIEPAGFASVRAVAEKMRAREVGT